MKVLGNYPEIKHIGLESNGRSNCPTSGSNTKAKFGAPKSGSMKIVTLRNILTLVAIALISQVNAQLWEELDAPPFQKHHSNGFSHEGIAYVFEGTYEESSSKELWQYTPEDDTWMQLPDFPGARRSISIGDDWDGLYYHGFGKGDPDDSEGPFADYLNDLWVFDPVTQTHTELPSCPCEGRTHPAFSAHNGKILMGSGSTFNGDLKDWWEYDMETQEWTEKEDIPGGDRHHPFFFAMDNSIYVGGGHQFNWLRWDLDTEQWSTIDDTPEGRVAGSQFAFNGLGFVLGGDDATHNHVPDVQSFMSYDPLTDEWQAHQPLPNGSRWAPSSFIIDGYVYFFGGLDDGDSNDNSMWRFNLESLDVTIGLDDSEFASNNTISIFPNPSHDFLLISGITEQANVKFISMTGETVLSIENLRNDRSKIDISTLPTGVYHVTVGTGELMEVIRFVKS